jgi:hypothetical protein
MDPDISLSLGVRTRALRAGGPALLREARFRGGIAVRVAAAVRPERCLFPKELRASLSTISPAGLVRELFEIRLRGF